MLLPAHVLLLLLLGAPRTGLAQKSSRTESISRCCTDTAPSEARKSQLEEAPPLSKRGPSYLPGQGPASGEAEHRAQGEDKGKRPFPAGPRARPLPHAQPRGRPQQGGAQAGGRAKLTLSLDVPTNIMNILFNIAKAKNLRAQAAANAHLMAQVGRK
ncbi:urocortin-3 [Pteropus vampyrus]|uniref:Urocortin-3 n=1 Tax=Pteropus vampyrus TaxID=132908 RepID=A0A6P3QZW9_PTEVA|nr:urocortin-3 [Pteropus vampyrus]